MRLCTLVYIGMNGTIDMFLIQIVREKRVPLNLSLINEQNVLPDVEHLRKISETDENRVVRIHSLGAIKATGRN